MFDITVAVGKTALPYARKAWYVRRRARPYFPHAGLLLPSLFIRP